MKERVRATQERQKKWHDKKAKLRSFIIGDEILVLNFGRGPKWLPGKVSSIRGPISVTVKLADGRSVRRHYDHIRASSLSEAEIVIQRDVVPRLQSKWSDSLSFGSEQELPPSSACSRISSRDDRPTSRRSRRSTSAKEIHSS